jgi:hypothetical protein
MANSITSFYQTVVTAAVEASQLLAPTWKAIESIYWDYRPEESALGQTLNVPIPNDPTSNVIDMGAGDIALNDIGFTTTPIVFDRHPSFAYVVRDFEQFNSPEMIRRVFMDAAMKGIKNQINSSITSLFTSSATTFGTTASPIAGVVTISTTGHVITVPQFLQGMSVLAKQNVPVANDTANMSLLLYPDVYMSLMDGTTGGSGAAWNQAFIAGARIPEQVHRTGDLPTTYGMSVKLEQQMPTTVVGGGSGTSTAAYMHRWAIAGVSRPLPKPDDKVVEYTYVNFAANPIYNSTFGDGPAPSFPIRVMIGYNQYPKQGYIVSIDAGYGLKVVRPNMCQLYSVAY